LIDRWLAGEFDLLVCEAIVDELIEKLSNHNVGRSDIEEFVARLDSMAEWVDISVEAIARCIPGDPDDDVVVACAVLGNADFLVTYDPHFAPLGDVYEGVRISKALPFLWAVRGDQRPQV
jgi:predicted nucleic acid-binding protein